jgi:hypothetical protein
MAKAYEALIDKIAAQERVPGFVGQALVDTENEARQPDLVLSESWGGGSHGLTMITLRTARSLGFRGTSTDLCVPETNLRYGLRYLKQMFDQVGKGDWMRAYAAYNAGPDLSPWPEQAVARFRSKFDLWVARRRPPGFQAPPAATQKAGAGGLTAFMVWGALLPMLVSLLKGKRR